MRGSRPERALEEQIEREGVLRHGERVLVACSGGADSVALAAALHAVSSPMHLTLTLAYVHHGTRDSAWQDECVALRVAAALGIDARVVGLAARERDEASLREARYGALADVARACGCTVVATGHHAEDQSETVLLALFRGAGIEGLGGMRPRRSLVEGIDVVRPLLRVPAAILLAYCHTHALPYAVDPTNADVSLRRNAVREALAILRPRFPGLDAAIARAATVVGDEREHAPRADLRRGVRTALAEASGLADVDFAHVEAVVRALERGNSGRFFMKSGVELRVDRGEIADIQHNE